MRRSRDLITGVVSCLIGAWGVQRAVAGAWSCDDAFISFRYAKNLVDGLGLVYNAGEHVEGYTNFLWTVLVAAAMKVGLEPVVFAQAAGVFFFAATIALLIRVSWSCTANSGAHGLLGLAAMGLAVHHHAVVFATGGLETAMFAFLVTLTMVLAVRARDGRTFTWLGAAATATVLTRPDGVVFLFVAAAAVALHVYRTRDGKVLLGFLIVTALPLGVYAAWKLSFYGDLRTNTYFAKSAHLSRFDQGLTYLRLYFASYAALGIAVIAMVGYAIRDGLTEGRDDSRSSPYSGPRALVLILLAVILYLVFVARVGGDFMFARFALPVTPLIFLGGELVLRRVNPVGIRYFLAASLVLGTLFARFPAEILVLGNPTGIVEEKHFYPATATAAAEAAGETFARITGDLPTRLAIYGSQAMLAYYADPLLVIEAHAGLTDAHIAHQPLQVRSRVGHEKSATMAYLLDRGVDFRFSFGLFRVQPNSLNQIKIGALAGEILCYRREILDPLRDHPEVEFVDFCQFLDQYIAGIESKNPQQVKREYAWFREYYFRQRGS